MFQSDLLGVDSEIKSDLKAPVKETKKKRRKEPVKKSKKNVTPLENFDYRLVWLLSLTLSLPSPNSLCTSFTEVIPLIQPEPSGTKEGERTEGGEVEMIPPPTQSTGPSFFSYIQTFNTNGWLEQERINNEVILPQMSNREILNEGGVLSPVPQPSFSMSMTNENSLLKTSFLPTPPVMENTSKREERSNGTNTKLSSLFNRMVTPNSNSNFFSTNSHSFNIEGFQKDNSLCFPFSFDQQT